MRECEVWRVESLEFKERETEMNRKSKTIWIVVVVLVLLAGAGIGGYLAAKKLIRHENLQDAAITELQGEIEYLESRLARVTDYYNFQAEYREDTYNYLALGNSLTLITSWGRGICSTKPDNDYFHLVKAGLEEKHGETAAYPVQFSEWERLGNRSKAYDLIDSYLDGKLDLVTIQLGENVTDTSTYEADLENLIRYIQAKAPKAKIVVIGDFWDKGRNESRKAAAEKTGAQFADLAGIIGDKSYQSKAGTVCELADGGTITVTEASATHPGDEGMRYIADRVLEAIQ